MSRNFGSSNNRERDVKNSFSSSGLAANLPSAAEMGRRTGANDSDTSWGRGTSAGTGANEESGAKPGVYRPPRQEGATWGQVTTSYAARRSGRNQDEPSEDLDDKWSRAFKSSSSSRNHPPQDAAPNAELHVNSRATGMKSFGGTDAPEGAGVGRRPFGDNTNRPPRREPWGEDRENNKERPPREEREGGGWAPREHREPREPREPRGEGDNRPPREFRDGGDREPREGGYRGGGRRNYGEGREERRPFGSGDARNEDFNRRGGGGRGRGGRGDDDREWENDPRFAGKFGRDLNSRFDNNRHSQQRGWEGPLPTAPKASLDAGATSAAGNPIPIFKEKVVPPKAPKGSEVNSENNSGTSTPKPLDAKAEKRKQEEEARKLKLEAEKIAKEEATNKLSISYSATMDAIKSGLKGKPLTEQVKSVAIEEHFSADGILKAILQSLDDQQLGSKWYDKAEFGDVLSSAVHKKSIKEEIALLYIVQEFCHSKKFPKIDVSKGVQKKLIELLITNLLVAHVVDIEGIIGWADDESDNDYPGRADAIIQTTGMISKLRESLEEEEESEADSDLDFDTPQAHV